MYCELYVLSLTTWIPIRASVPGFKAILETIYDPSDRSKLPVHQGFGQVTNPDPSGSNWEPYTQPRSPRTYCSPYWVAWIFPPMAARTFNFLLQIDSIFYNVPQQIHATCPVAQKMPQVIFLTWATFWVTEPLQVDVIFYSFLFMQPLISFLLQIHANFHSLLLVHPK